MHKSIQISGRKIGKGNPVFIIAEAGVNHNGRLSLAKKLVDAAKKAGADAVKFQTFITENLATCSAPKAEYQKKNIGGKHQFNMLKKLELSWNDFRALASYCRSKGIIFLSTPFDFESAKFLNSLGVSAFKISSCDLNNTPYLKYLAGFGKPLILSTGMADMPEIRQAVKAVYSTGNKKLILLHCTTNYPVEYSEVNLKAIRTLQNEFPVPVGFSDHTDGIHAAAAAVALDVSVIEKHFTLDKNMPGPDHKASLDQRQLELMVRSIREIEKALGNGIKKPYKSELKIKNVVRKSVVAVCGIPKGRKITRSMLGLKRPGTGIEPALLNTLVGKRTKVSIKNDTVISWDQLC